MIRVIKKYFVKTVSILLALLFIYAAASKMLDFENFQVQLAQSPLLSAYAGIISCAILIIEFGIAVMLLIPESNRWGLYLSVGLMSAFTIYIFLILNFSDFIPCSCGGILEKLGWTEHLIFNIFFLLLAILAVYIKAKDSSIHIQKELSFSFLIIIVSCIIIFILFQTSEHIIKKENNFTRRFLPHAVLLDKNLNLQVNSYYFAGMDDGKIYLGNLTTPLFITKIDTNLQNLTRVKLALDNKDYPFKSVQLKVKAPYFYLFDGNVPIIYRGSLSDSSAQTISYGDAFFNQLTVLDSTKFALRTQRRADNHYVIALLELGEESKLELKPSILEKQIDGVFDVDGLLASDPTKGRIVYTYFYRNEFIVLDSNLTVQNRLKTIDTTHTAKISLTKLSDGKTKMNAPPWSVNKGFAIKGDLLFNRSNLKGKHEPNESWNTSSIIDVYKTNEHRYVGSFYIRHKDGKAISSMITDGQYLYVLIGQELQRYRIRDRAFN